LTTLIAVFRADLTGQASLEAVRLLNRMIKERRFAVHPHVLSCLLHLRLQTELGIRASEWRADKEEKRKARGKHSTNRSASRRAKGKAAETPHLSKKTKKVLKENKEIESEMQEAAAEVDKEEKANAVRTLFFVAISRPANVRFVHGLLMWHCDSRSVANRNAQAVVCTLLPDLEERPADAAALGSTAWYLTLCAQRQRRLLP
jgi:hypothetical protein